MVAEEYGEGSFREAVLGEKGDETELGQETRLGKARDSFEDITKDKRFAVGVTEEREETKFGEGGEGNGRHINADRLRRGEKGTKIIIDYVDGGHAGVSGDNGVEEGIDTREGGGVGPHIIPYHYSVSPYCPSNPPLSQSMHLIPLLLHHTLKVSGVLRGTHDRKETLEGDQELDQLLLIRKRPLLAMRPANSGGEGERLPCPVEV